MLLPQDLNRLETSRYSESSISSKYKVGNVTSLHFKMEVEDITGFVGYDRTMGWMKNRNSEDNVPTP
jgi:hypothetical protein